jgi:hypothetical protein
VLLTGLMADFLFALPAPGAFAAASGVFVATVTPGAVAAAELSPPPATLAPAVAMLLPAPATLLPAPATLPAAALVPAPLIA